ncbi:MAG TPA: VOC family protein [Nocardioides sp.]|nr:VOC family protein [Nocardioides sp.]
MPSLSAITLYAHNPVRLANFWSAVLDLPIDPEYAAAIAADALAATDAVLVGREDALHLWISPAEDVPHADGRIHLEVDLASAAEVDLLLALGATHEWDGPDRQWSVFADPEGNRFCAGLQPDHQVSAP